LAYQPPTNFTFLPEETNNQAAVLFSQQINTSYQSNEQVAREEIIKPNFDFESIKRWLKLVKSRKKLGIKPNTRKEHPQHKHTRSTKTRQKGTRRQGHMRLGKLYVHVLTMNVLEIKLTAG
jgi:hypothetical protein